MINIKVILIVLGMGMLFLSSISAYAADKHWTVPKGATVGTIIQGVKKGAENDPAVRACRGFTLTQDQVLTLFRYGRIINFHELHYEFDQAPCIIEGELKSGRESVSWQIDALLLTRIHFRDGREIVLGCDDKCLAAVYPQEGSGQSMQNAASAVKSEKIHK